MNVNENVVVVVLLLACLATMAAKLDPTGAAHDLFVGLSVWLIRNLGKRKTKQD